MIDRALIIYIIVVTIIVILVLCKCIAREDTPKGVRFYGLWDIFELKCPSCPIWLSSYCYKTHPPTWNTTINIPKSASAMESGYKVTTI